MEAWKEELYHHGILGMKWGKKNGPPYPLGASDHSASEKKAGWRKSLGRIRSSREDRNVRRFQNPDGSLTEAGVQRLEKKAVQKAYKKSRKEGGSYVLKPFRRGTGENYDKAAKDFYDRMKKDPKLKELSRKAFDAEKKRLLAEKGYSGDSDEYYKYINSKEGIRLANESENAQRVKEKYIDDLAKEFVNNELKDAKIKDLGITDHIDIAKKYLSTKEDFYEWDGNLEYNPDNYYDDWVEKIKFK